MVGLCIRGSSHAWNAPMEFDITESEHVQEGLHAWNLSCVPVCV